MNELYDIRETTDCYKICRKKYLDMKHVFIAIFTISVSKSCIYSVEIDKYTMIIIPVHERAKMNSEIEYFPGKALFDL